MSSAVREAAGRRVNEVQLGDARAADRIVWLRNSERIAARLRAAGVEVELRRYDGIGHIRILAAMTNPDSATTPTLADIVRFVERGARATAAPATRNR